MFKNCSDFIFLMMFKPSQSSQLSMKVIDGPQQKWCNFMRMLWFSVMKERGKIIYKVRAIVFQESRLQVHRSILYQWSCPSFCKNTLHSALFWNSLFDIDVDYWASVLVFSFYDLSTKREAIELQGMECVVHRILCSIFLFNHEQPQIILIIFYWKRASAWEVERENGWRFWQFL